MKAKELYIIGNGFDIHHGYHSKYSDFRNFLVGENYKIIETLEKYLLDGIDLWGDFEQSLAYLDTDSLQEEFSDSLVSYASDDWSEAYHHEYTDYINDIIGLMTKEMKLSFTEWVNTISREYYFDEDGYETSIYEDLTDEEKELKESFVETENANKKINRLVNNNEALFINFNYTNTLETIYEINQDSINYIHGVRSKRNTIILGHGVNVKNTDQYFIQDEDGSYSGDPRVDLGIRMMMDYYKKNSKPTNEIITINKSYFENLNEVDYIYILGHSLSDVDIPYILEIIKHINITKVIWTVSYYTIDDKEIFLKKLVGCGISENNINMTTLAELNR